MSTRTTPWEPIGTGSLDSLISGLTKFLEAMETWALDPEMIVDLEELWRVANVERIVTWLALNGSPQFAAQFEEKAVGAVQTYLLLQIDASRVARGEVILDFTKRPEGGSPIEYAVARANSHLLSNPRPNTEARLRAFRHRCQEAERDFRRCLDYLNDVRHVLEFKLAGMTPKQRAAYEPEYVSAKDIANLYGLNADAARQKLNRFAKTNGDVVREIQDAGPKEPQRLYLFSKVRHLFETG